MNISKENIEALRGLIECEPRNVVVLSHTNPDGDALGSSLAWAEALRQRGHKVTCIVPNRFPYYLEWMSGLEDMVIFKCDQEQRAAAAVAAAELIFCLDFHSLHRLDAPLSELIASNTTARRILIDHHLDPPQEFDIMFSYPDASSTSYLVYKVIEALWGAQSV
ncbi:MAG: DHH family phosphoesterase, partial [Alistipes sp.]|nr:DHH family phosphoesterase [Alistipes sp.]